MGEIIRTVAVRASEREVVDGNVCTVAVHAIEEQAVAGSA